MNKEHPEYKRISREVVKIVDWQFRHTHNLLPTTYADSLRSIKGNILSIPGIEIADPDQSMPEGVFNYEQHKRIFKDSNFKKVI